MSGGKQLISSCVMLSILAAPLVSRAEPPDFLTELNQVREAMLNEPAKGYYEGPFNKAFYGRFPNWLNQCTPGFPQAVSALMVAARPSRFTPGGTSRRRCCARSPRISASQSSRFWGVRRGGHQGDDKARLWRSSCWSLAAHPRCSAGREAERLGKARRC